MCIDFPKVLKEGLNTVIAEAQEELQKLKFMDPDSVHKERYLKAVILTHQAVIGYARRFANLAVEMATKEKDPVRKKELERMAEACRWVPTNPARTFYEAIQSFWFLFLMINPSPTAVPGRFDQYDQEPYQATLLNMKFHPTALKSTADLKKLAALMKTYFNQGGKHVQFNVVDRATLVAAQEKPNENRDLVVRVARNTAYPDVQWSTK